MRQLYENRGEFLTDSWCAVWTLRSTNVIEMKGILHELCIVTSITLWHLLIFP